jgi:hypothetical protein
MIAYGGQSGVAVTDSKQEKERLVIANTDLNLDFPFLPSHYLPRSQDHTTPSSGVAVSCDRTCAPFRIRYTPHPNPQTLLILLPLLNPPRVSDILFLFLFSRLSQARLSLSHYTPRHISHISYLCVYISAPLSHRPTLFNLRFSYMCIGPSSASILPSPHAHRSPTTVRVGALC